MEFTLVIDDKSMKYRIKFWHDRDLSTAYRILPISISCCISGITHCAIVDKDDKKIAEANSFCSVLDCFNKERGRKISLARALQYTPFTKEQRKVVWEAYLNRKRG